MMKSWREAGEKDLPVLVRTRGGRDGGGEEDEGGEEEGGEEDESPLEHGVSVVEGSDGKESQSEGDSKGSEGETEDDGEEALGESHGISKGAEELETLRIESSTMDFWRWWARRRAVRCMGSPASIMRMANQMERDQMEMQVGERRAVSAG